MLNVYILLIRIFPCCMYLSSQDIHTALVVIFAAMLSCLAANSLIVMGVPKCDLPSWHALCVAVYTALIDAYSTVHCH